MIPQFSCTPANLGILILFNLGLEKSWHTAHIDQPRQTQLTSLLISLREE